MNELPILDLILILLLLIGAFLGTRRGLMQNFLILCRSFLTFSIALHHYQVLGKRCHLYTERFFSIEITYFFVFLGLSLLLYFAATILIYLINKIVEVKFISIIEKPIGLILGTLQMTFFSFLILFAILLLPLPFIQEKITQHSTSNGLFKENLIKGYDLLSETLHFEKKFSEEFVFKIPEEIIEVL